MHPVVSAFARAGAFAVTAALAMAIFPSTASASPAAALSAAPAPQLVIPVQDVGDEYWRRRGAWNDDGDFRNTDPGPRPEWRRRPGRDHWGWERDPWEDDYPRYHRRRPTVYFDLDLTPQRYIQPRYHERRQYRVVRLPRAHVAWCYDRYRSYRASDNSFQPHYGPRRECRSPYF